MNEYRKEHNLPSYREERRIRKVSIEELSAKNKELEKRLKQKEKELADEKETVEILKKSLKAECRDQGKLVCLWA